MGELKKIIGEIKYWAWFEKNEKQIQQDLNSFLNKSKVELTNTKKTILDKILNWF